MIRPQPAPRTIVQALQAGKVPRLEMRTRFLEDGVVLVLEAREHAQAEGARPGGTRLRTQEAVFHRAPDEAPLRVGRLPRARHPAVFERHRARGAGDHRSRSLSAQRSEQRRRGAPPAPGGGDGQEQAGVQLGEVRSVMIGRRLQLERSARVAGIPQPSGFRGGQLGELAQALEVRHGGGDGRRLLEVLESGPGGPRPEVSHRLEVARQVRELVRSQLGRGGGFPQPRRRRLAPEIGEGLRVFRPCVLLRRQRGGLRPRSPRSRPRRHEHDVEEREARQPQEQQ